MSHSPWASQKTWAIQDSAVKHATHITPKGGGPPAGRRARPRAGALLFPPYLSRQLTITAAEHKMSKARKETASEKGRILVVWRGALTGRLT
eukprot:8427604-Pyramimonas_sp.AAC.1